MAGVVAILTMFLLFAAVYGICFHYWEVIPVRRRIVARLKGTAEPSDADVKRVGFSVLFRHRVSWPLEWSTPEQANERGAELLSELWPDELPLPAVPGRFRWTQRTTKVE